MKNKKEIWNYNIATMTCFALMTLLIWTTSLTEHKPSIIFIVIGSVGIVIYEMIWYKKWK